MIKEESAMKKRNNESGPPRRKYNPFEQDNLYLFPLARTFVDDEIKQPTDEENQKKLLELMYTYQIYHDVLIKKLENQYALRGSKIRCTYGTKTALLDCIEDYGVLKGNLPLMVCSDCRISNIHNFGSCQCPESFYEGRLPMTAPVHPNGQAAVIAKGNRYAHICVPIIDMESGWQQEENELWIDNYGNVIKVLADSAFLVCRYGGDIWFAEAAYSEVMEDEYRKYLQIKGFPKEYIDYLEELHEIYPLWKFEAVQTDIDFEEFVDFQYTKKYKCTDEVSESDGQIYAGEKSGKYYEVKRSIIHQHADPYYILRLEAYLPVMQFLKAEQFIPKEYSDKIVDNILKNRYNDALCEKVKNMKISSNPIFIASIIAAENGPYGEKYQDKYVYNMFNFGATSGRTASKKYAYDNNWFTEDDCLNACERLFGKFLDRGQNTLYSLDWHFRGYADSTGVYQYATLVRDADDKTKVLDFDQEEAKDYPFVFSIPVYNNIRTI